jgi:hypothetical protein
MCSLAICKPSIRRVAKKNDWVAGLGSRNSPSGDLSRHLVYAMRVEEVLTLKEYDQQAPTRWPQRIPNVMSADLWDRLGDCIYDYSKGSPLQRPSVHGVDNVETDIGGQNVLLSRDFYYLGRSAIELPDHLHPICHQTQGHRSDSNADYLDAFVSWIRKLPLESGRMYGWPDFAVDWGSIASRGGCSIRKLDRESDAPC